jgi:hypothetical protein
MTKLAAALAAFLALAPQEPPAEKVRELVARLGSDEIAAREDALRAIVELGEPVIPLLKELLSKQADAETVARMRTALKEIERNIARSLVYRPARPVTLKGVETTLGEMVREACAAAGIEGSADASVAGRKVAFQAEREPVLRVLDRLCAAQGDLSVQMAEGKVRIAKEKPAPGPASYADGFRARLRRIHTTDVNDFDASTSTVILYVVFDSQPDLQPRSSRYSGEARGRAADGAEVLFRPVAMERLTGMSQAGAKGVMHVDDVAIPFDSDVRAESACYLKSAPAGLRRLESLKVKATYRFASGQRTFSCKVRGNGEMATFDGLAVTAYVLGGPYIQLQPLRGGASVRIEDLVDPDSLVVVRDGKEEKLTRHSPRSNQYLYRSAAEIASGSEIRVSAFDDVFEKECEFEFRDVILQK